VGRRLGRTARLQRAEVKGNDTRSLRPLTATSVLTAQCLARSVTQAPIEATVTLVVALGGQLRPLAMDAQQRVLERVLDADASTAPLGLETQHAAQVGGELLLVQPDELLVGATVSPRW
jgi:hypothetical protein